MRNLQPDLVPEDVNAVSLTNVDAEVSAVQSPLTDLKQWHFFFETGNISVGDDKVKNISNGLEEEPMESHGNLTSYLIVGSSKIFLVFN